MSARVEVADDLAGRADDEVVRQEVVERPSERRRRVVGGGGQRRDLAARVHAGIRPAGEFHALCLAGELHNSGLQHALDGALVGLRLRPDEVRAVVFDKQGNSAARAVGGAGCRHQRQTSSSRAMCEASPLRCTSFTTRV